MSQYIKIVNPQDNKLAEYSIAENTSNYNLNGFSELMLLGPCNENCINRNIQRVHLMPSNTGFGYMFLSLTNRVEKWMKYE